MVAGLVASAGVGACMAKCSGAAEKEKEKVSFWRPILAKEAGHPWCWLLALLSFADPPGEKSWRRGVPLILKILTRKRGQELVHCLRRNT